MIKKAIHATILLALICAIMRFFSQAPTSQDVVAKVESRLVAQDFVYHYLLAQSSRMHHESSPYSDTELRNNLTLLCQDELGSDCPNSDPMPVGISPVGITGLALSGMLLGASSYSSYIAYCIFVAISLVAWAYLLAQAAKNTDRLGRFIVVPLLLSLLTVSDVFSGTLRLGQASMLVAALVSLVLFLKPDSKGRFWIIVLALIISATKLHYFIISLVLTLCLRCWRETLVSLLIICVIVLIGTEVFAGNILLDYVRSLSSYAAGLKFEWYRNPYTLGQFLPTNERSNLAIGLLLSGTFGLLGLIRKEVRWASLMVLGYLLFSPYVGEYELLLVAIPISAAISPCPKARDVELI